MAGGWRDDVGVDVVAVNELLVEGSVEEEREARLGVVAHQPAQDLVGVAAESLEPPSQQEPRVHGDMEGCVDWFDHGNVPAAHGSTGPPPRRPGRTPDRGRPDAEALNRCPP